MSSHCLTIPTRFSGQVLVGVLCLLVAGCGGVGTRTPGTMVSRTGDEIVVAGRLVHTGTPVVLWMDPGGYDAYRVERRFSPYEESAWKVSDESVKALTTPNRYGVRRAVLTREELEQVRGGGWDLDLLQQKVDQFVLHFDGCGTSRRCFEVLHDERCLSIHFLLDLDGTIYQTLDLKERAWHATISNSRSVGIEIANIGAQVPAERARLDEWYQREANGSVRVVLPMGEGESGIRTPGFVARPARSDRVTGSIHGRELEQYDFTNEQYDALIKLTATLCRVFPKMRCDYPRDASGDLVPRKLPDEELRAYTGLIGHYHIQTNKVDPGPAFQWDRVVDGARQWLGSESSPRLRRSSKPAAAMMAPRR